MGEKDKATADLKKVLMLEPANKQAKEDLESLTMTPEEVNPGSPAQTTCRAGFYHAPHFSEEATP